MLDLVCVYCYFHFDVDLRRFVCLISVSSRHVSIRQTNRSIKDSRASRLIQNEWRIVNFENRNTVESFFADFAVVMQPIDYWLSINR